MLRHLLNIFIVLLVSIPIYAQSQDSVWNVPMTSEYPFVHIDKNKIENEAVLATVFRKLQKIQNTHKGKLTIVHIGDSHMQGDGMTSVVRKGMQQYFGNAGRGLVFPYQLAGSNAPKDVKSWSNTTWKSNKITIPGMPLATGISGYGIHTCVSNINVCMRLKDEEERYTCFDKMTFFISKSQGDFLLRDSLSEYPLPIKDTNLSTLTAEISSPIKSFELQRKGSNLFSFYGVSLENKDSSGVLYHTIGVNGARYDQYLRSPLFFEQLKVLSPDLYIISMGTNEAQTTTLDKTKFIAKCDSFVAALKEISPNAEVLITTPAGSYFRQKKPNGAVSQVTEALNEFTHEKHLPFWDLYNITGGLQETPMWKKYNLIAGDLVHYSAAGYALQGQLLLQSISLSYNNYVEKHPYKKTTITVAKPNINKAKPTNNNGISGINPEIVIPKDSVMKEKVEVSSPQKKKSNIKVEYLDN